MPGGLEIARETGVYLSPAFRAWLDKIGVDEFRATLERTFGLKEASMPGEKISCYQVQSKTLADLVFQEVAEVGRLLELHGAREISEGKLSSIKAELYDRIRQVEYLEYLHADRKRHQAEVQRNLEQVLKEVAAEQGVA